MPDALPHYCAQPGCGALVTGAARCPAHEPQRSTWNSHPRIRGRRLQRLRRRLFDEQPLCVACLALTPPLFTVATIRDHKVPLAEGGQDDETNVQPLCQRCSDLKTQGEALRGRRREGKMR